MEKQIRLSVLNQLIRDALLDAFPGSLWVVAEIAELKINRTGHCYLELIEHEDDEIIARARATIWSYSFRMLKPYFETTTGQLFSQGLKVLVNATVEFHPSYGLSLNIKDIDPTYTLGDLAKQRSEIIKRLQREGVFDMNRELPLPLVPQRIAVISSASAAGYQDFMDQIENNVNGFRFFTTLFGATMQGDEAVPTIINAFDRIFAVEDQFDLVVVIRGGGAVADLNCFDNYDLAFTVTQFPLPVITGIGHEKDDTILDRIAHTKLKTPTAVAEFLILGVQRFLNLLHEKGNAVMNFTDDILRREELVLTKLINRFSRCGNEFFSEKSKHLTQLVSGFHRNSNQYTFRKSLLLNGFKHTIAHLSERLLQVNKHKAENGSRNMEVLVKGLLVRKNEELAGKRGILKKNSTDFIYREAARQKGLVKTIELLRPENILKRGYSLTLREGKILKEMRNLNPGDEIETRFTDGSVFSEITKKYSHDS